MVVLDDCSRLCGAHPARRRSPRGSRGPGRLAGLVGPGARVALRLVSTGARCARGGRARPARHRPHGGAPHPGAARSRVGHRARLPGRPRSRPPRHGPGGPPRRLVLGRGAAGPPPAQGAHRPRRGARSRATAGADRSPRQWRRRGRRRCARRPRGPPGRVDHPPSAGSHRGDRGVRRREVTPAPQASAHRRHAGARAAPAGAAARPEGGLALVGRRPGCALTQGARGTPPRAGAHRVHPGGRPPPAAPGGRGLLSVPPRREEPARAVRRPLLRRLHPRAGLVVPHRHCRPGQPRRLPQPAGDRPTQGGPARRTGSRAPSSPPATGPATAAW